MGQVAAVVSLIVCALASAAVAWLMGYSAWQDWQSPAPVEGQRLVVGAALVAVVVVVLSVVGLRYVLYG